MNMWTTENFQDSEDILYNTVMVDTCHLSKPVEYVDTKSEP